METFVINWKLYGIQRVGKHDYEYELYVYSNGIWCHIDTAKTKEECRQIAEERHR